MRLIDADELKKCAIPCEIHNGALTDLCVPLYQIDNAETVELDEGVIQEVLNKRCMTAVANEYLIALHGNGTRSQGEWKFKKFDEKTGIPNSYWCPFCGMVKAQVYDNFCGNCGAKMKGGAECQ